MSQVSVSDAVHLADVFATITRELESAADPAQTHEVVTRRAVEMVPGCAHAGITLIRRGGSVTSVAATGEIADRIHVIQNGLCVEKTADRGGRL